MLDLYPDVLSVSQMAEILGVGLNTAYELIRSNKIKSVRIGKQIRIPKIALKRLLDAEDE